MASIAKALIASGPAGLLVLAVLDGAGVPIPGGVDVLLVFLASRRPEQAYLLAALAVIGSIAGNLVLYFMARKGGEIYLRRHSLSRGGRLFQKWFQHYGLLTVFISALVPLPVMPMKIFVICSGALGASLAWFIFVFGIARVLRYGGLAYLGGLMGGDAIVWLRMHVRELLLFAAALFVVLFLMVKVADHLRARRSAPR
ncbi:MAG: VTT domain-containing protein [Acidobacteria bacterium]|nr:VTT domain-containing protein [Acidobacteriota bacterium]